jgi:hypothetical protein
MVQLALAFVTAALVSVQATPILNKRIAQDIVASLAKWEAVCLAATNRDQNCNKLKVGAFGTLLANAAVCDQQDAADSLMAFSKAHNNSELVALTQIFSQQPRNSPNSVSNLYCQKAPQNPELDGLFQCQYKGNNPKTFVGGSNLGETGTIPFGRTAPLNPLGSCPANPQGPIADGSQLVDITTTPFAPGSSNVAATDTGSNGTPSTPSAPSDDDGNSPPSSSLAEDASVPTAAPTSTGDFHLQNGRDAQSLNAKFSSLDATSSCTDGETACVDGKVAQCANGVFSIEACGSGTQCFALPLVNKPGTSVTCDTEDDALKRINDTGATGGITG